MNCDNVMCSIGQQNANLGAELAHDVPMLQV
jgi:hypothetical protein